jgi:hypothetical protein
VPVRHRFLLLGSKIALLGCELLGCSSPPHVTFWCRHNFSYVDQIYDGLLADGVRPFVELSFMPKKLAARDVLHAFWYKQNVSPPKDYAKWDNLITRFTGTSRGPLRDR